MRSDSCVNGVVGYFYTRVAAAGVMCHQGAGVVCTTSRVSARRVDAGPRGALSPSEAGRGQLQALPGARRGLVMAALPCSIAPGAASS